MFLNHQILIVVLDPKWQTQKDLKNYCLVVKMKKKVSVTSKGSGLISKIS